MFPSLINMAMLAVEAQEVVLLRTMKLAAGGTGATSEAYRMVAEKIAAAQEATVGLLSGQSPDHIVTGYRKKVRANARRLHHPVGKSTRKKT